MQRRTLSLVRNARWIFKRPLVWAGVIGLVGAAALVPTSSAHATTYPPSTSSCTFSNSSTRPNSIGVTGVTPGSTVTISCTAGSFPAGTLLALIEASGLAGIVSPSSDELNEVDLGTLQLATAGTDGSLSATFNVPATYTASDSQATCPPSRAQINAGLTCELIIANLAAAPQNVAELVYQGQPRPNAPTLHTTFTVKQGVTTLTASDAPGACTTPATAWSRCWWGAPVPGAPNPTAFTGIPGLEVKVGNKIASNTLTVSPAVYCEDGATAAACAGLPAGTLVPPQLSGTITTHAGRQPVIVDEPNTTPYWGNGFLKPLIPGTFNVQAIEIGPPVPFCSGSRAGVWFPVGCRPPAYPSRP